MRAIVTGSTSGIGLACLKRLQANGARVVGMDVRPSIETAESANYRHVTCDLADVRAVRAAVDDAAEWLGRIDALLHFGAAWSGKPWDQVDVEEWDRVGGVTLRGTFFLTQAVAKHMLSNGAGSIVLTGSDSVNMGGVAGGPAYVASKGGVVALTRSFARALGPKGIRVNAINPGVIDTPMTSSWPKPVKDDVVIRTPLGRLGVPDDVARVAVMLADDTSVFITGEVVEVNGGFYFG
jgi:3-oxoacyl-[acyl-carrier protein] reductase